MENHYRSLQIDKFLKKEFFGEDWCFSKGFDEQKSAVDQVLKNESMVFLISGVHASVYTLGNSLKSNQSLESGFVQTDRGGRVMYHGPGQLTLYPIFKLQRYFSGPKAYMQFLFDLCIEHFKNVYSIELHCKKNGLWTLDGKKVGFVGLRVKKGIAYHGLSLNYNVDLSAFIKHSPCDISGDQAGNLFVENFTSFEKEAGVLMEEFFQRLTLRDAELR